MSDSTIIGAEVLLKRELDELAEETAKMILPASGLKPSPNPLSPVKRNRKQRRAMAKQSRKRNRRKK